MWTGLDRHQRQQRGARTSDHVARSEIGNNKRSQKSGDLRLVARSGSTVCRDFGWIFLPLFSFRVLPVFFVLFSRVHSYRRQEQGKGGGGGKNKIVFLGSATLPLALKCKMLSKPLPLLDVFHSFIG